MLNSPLPNMGLFAPKLDQHAPCSSISKRLMPSPLEICKEWIVLFPYSVAVLQFLEQIIYKKTY